MNMVVHSREELHVGFAEEEIQGKWRCHKNNSNETMNCPAAKKGRIEQTLGELWGLYSIPARIRDQWCYLETEPTHEAHQPRFEVVAVWGFLQVSAGDDLRWIQ